MLAYVAKFRLVDDEPWAILSVVIPVAVVVLVVFGVLWLTKRKDK